MVSAGRLGLLPARRLVPAAGFVGEFGDALIVGCAEELHRPLAAASADLRHKRVEFTLAGFLWFRHDWILSI